MSLRPGALVRLRGTTLTGQILDIIEHADGSSFAVVSWSDHRIVPNPRLEPMHRLEEIDR